jgi:signal transduction histidine kinase
MLGITFLAVVFVANGLLAVILLLNNSRATLNRVFASLMLTLAAWSVVVYLEDWPAARSLIEPLARIDYLLATFMLGLFYFFCRVLSRRGSRYFDAGVIILTSITALMAVGGLVVQVTFEGSHLILRPYLGYGPLAALLIGTLGGGLWLLGQRYRTSRGKERAQIRLVGFGVGLSIVTLLIADVIAPIVFGISSPDVALIGVYGIMFFTAFSTYAIIKHRFMDIRLLVARSLTYLMLLVTLATGYSVAALQLGGLFFPDMGHATAREVYNVALALVLAFTFQPLRTFFERLTNRIFFRDQYESQQVLNEFSKVIVSELDLERLLRQSLAQICTSMRIEFAQVIVFHNDRVYRVEHFGPVPRRLMVAPELRRLNKPFLIADELPEGERRKIMEDHDIRVAITLKAHNEFIGYLLLGDKLSGDIYSTQDIDLLEIINKELAVAVLNAKAYAEIQEFNATLQARVDHATNRLRVANRHLKELDHAKDEFISMASHQLRTPLTTIKGYLSMMQEGDAGKLTPAQKDFVDYAFGSAERMVNLISDLLNVSRLSAGRFLIQAKPTDMVQMLADEVRQLRTHATTKGIDLIFEPPAGNFPLVELDDNKTRQVVMNFIDNAIYYTQEGSVKVVLSHTDDHARLEVIDSGIGVPDEAKKKLFSKFFRAENAQVVRPDGTGLGLYLARRVIEDQGGTIIFKSTQGKGSIFGFELPIHAPVKAKTKEKHGRH